MGHYLAHNACDIMCVVEEQFVLWKIILDVFCGFDSREFSFLYSYNCWRCWDFAIRYCMHDSAVLNEDAI